MAEIDLNDLSLSYKEEKEERQILNHLSASFSGNKLISIIGESGSGKSTLLNVLAGYLKSYQGDVKWSCPLEQIGMVFQNLYLIDHLTVLENVMLPLLIYGEGRKESRLKALDCLKEVGLDGLENRSLGQISGGQKARVALARSLSLDSQIILADEPTGSLDSLNSLMVMKLLKKLSSKRLFIVVTHNEKMAMEISDEVYSLQGGKLLLLKKEDHQQRGGFKKEEKKKAYGHISTRDSISLAFSFLHKRLVKVLSSLLFVSVCFGLVLLILAFSQGGKKELEKLATDCLDYTAVSLAEKRKYEIPNQEMKLIKKVRLSSAKKNMLKSLDRNLVFYPSLDFFIPTLKEAQCVESGFKDNVFFTPSFPEAERLKEGRIPKAYDECVINSALQEASESKLGLGSLIEFHNDASIVTKITSDKQVTDILSLSIAFKVVGLSCQKDIVSRASLFYDLPLLKNHVLSKRLSNLSKAWNRDFTLQERLDIYADEDDPLTSFKTLAYCADPLTLKAAVPEDEAEFLSYPLEMASSLQDITASFASFASIFLGLSALCSFFLEIVIVESLYKEKKEEMAVYLSFHITKKDFYRLGQGQILILAAGIIVLSALFFLLFRLIGNWLLAGYGLSSFIGLDLGFLPWVLLLFLSYSFAWASGMLPLHRIYVRDLVLSLKGE